MPCPLSFLFSFLVIVSWCLGVMVSWCLGVMVSLCLCVFVLSCCCLVLSCFCCCFRHAVSAPLCGKVRHGCMNFCSCSHAALSRKGAQTPHAYNNNKTRQDNKTTHRNKTLCVFLSLCLCVYVSLCLCLVVSLYLWVLVS